MKKYFRLKKNTSSAKSKFQWILQIEMQNKGIWIEDFVLAGLFNIDIVSGEDSNPNVHVQISIVPKAVQPIH